MATFFKVNALPASCGDALWLEFGSGSGATGRILIDGGKISSYEPLYERVRALPSFDNIIHLLVVTHIDADHIEGIIGLLTDARLRLNIGDIWFNGWPQISGGVGGTLGALQGEFLSALLAKNWARKWNISWSDSPGRSIVRPDDDLLPAKSCEGMSLTLLSPDATRLAGLREHWMANFEGGVLRSGDFERALRILSTRPHRRLVKGALLGEEAAEWLALLRAPFRNDEAPANGSSLAFLADFEGGRCLLLGDAFPEVVRNAIEKLARQEGVERLPVGLMKVSHHGSRNNTDEALLSRIDCKHFLFSTDGSVHGHPDEECVARIVEVCGPETHLHFNFDHSKRDAWWDDAGRQARHRFHVHYPRGTASGIEVLVD